MTTRKINKAERVALVRAMETVARAVNDEDVFDHWLTYGVADGDIDETTTDDELSYYIEGDTFASLMGDFMHLMKLALADGIKGALYCDGEVSE